MSCMLRKKLWVPAGALAQLIAGDVPSPTATPGAAWLNLTGIWPPSGNPEMVRVIAGAAGAPLPLPLSWAESMAARESVIVNRRSNRIGIYYRGNGKARELVCL